MLSSPKVALVFRRLVKSFARESGRQEQMGGGHVTHRREQVELIVRGHFAGKGSRRQREESEQGGAGREGLQPGRKRQRRLGSAVSWGCYAGWSQASRQPSGGGLLAGSPAGKQLGHSAKSISEQPSARAFAPRARQNDAGAFRRRVCCLRLRRFGPCLPDRTLLSPPRPLLFKPHLCWMSR